MNSQSSNKTKRILVFLSILFIFAVAVFVFYFENRLNAQNTTALALSYKYGLIPRGFVGNILYQLKHVFNIDFLTYKGAYVFSFLSTVIYFIILFVLYTIALVKSKERQLPIVETIIIFLSVFMFPEFLTFANFGRLDEYLMIVTLLCVILLIVEKFEFLLIPLCCIASMIHVGFVFTNVAVILVALIWKAFEKTGKQRIKYIFLFLGCFLSVSAFFLYFEVLQEPFSQEAYNEIVTLAKSMSEDGMSISDSLLDSEVLKLDVFDDEWIWHVHNFVEAPIFLFFFSPYIYIAFRFFKGLFKRTEKLMDKLKYLVVLLGVVTIVPELILKVDYGRWVYCIFAYYSLTFLILIVGKDEGIISQCKETFEWIKNKISFYAVLLIYPLLFMPFRDVHISDITTRIMEYFAPIFGIW